MKEQRVVTYGMVDLDCGSGQEGGQGYSSRSSALCPSDGARRLSLPMIQSLSRANTPVSDCSERFRLETYS